MARDYTSLFDRVKLYASVISKSNSFTVDIDSSKLHQGDILPDDADDLTLLKDLLTLDNNYLSQFNSKISGYQGQLNNYLLGDGSLLVQSSASTAALIAADIATFMASDSETVLSNTVGNSVAIESDGDGSIGTLTQTQLTKADIITLTCTTAQNGGDAVFSIRSDKEGVLAGSVTADGTTSFSNTATGISSLIVNAGTAGNEWALTDLITITTTSDDISILMSLFRDAFKVLLPNTASSPTITNTLVDVVSAFPGSPVDGQEVVLKGLRYFFSNTDSEWFESCI